MQETCVWTLGGEDPMEMEMATHTSILTCEIPWQRSLVGYSPWGCKRVGHSLATKQQCMHMHAKKRLYLDQGSLAMTLLTFWARYHFVEGRKCCPLHCSMLISTPGLYLPDVSSTLLDGDHQKWHMSPGGPNCFRLRTATLVDGKTGNIYFQNSKISMCCT